ncbi:MAG: GAF domain-containing sensor histidine kinase, partial [Chloroflexota bacterium]
LVLAAIDNAVPSLFHRQLNRLVVEYPLLFLADLAFSAFLIGASGGARSPYYLYALGPLLAAGLFFEVEGGLLAAGVFSVLYGAVLVLGGVLLQLPTDWQLAASSVASFFLVAGLFGFSARLLERSRHDTDALRQLKDEMYGMNRKLERNNAELETVQDLGIAMQSTIEPEDVQEKILVGLTTRLGFDRAVLALADIHEALLTSWLIADKRQAAQVTRLRYAGHVPVDRDEGGAIARAVIDRAPVLSRVGGSPGTLWLERLGLRSFAVVPLISRGHVLGVVIVDNSASGREIGPDDLRSVVRVANHGAVALANVRLCVERTYKLAVEEERNRIAMEIHDVVSQSLSGIVYNLDGCARMLPERSSEVKARLAEISAHASKTLAEVRRSIFDLWPGTSAEATFVDDVQDYFRGIGLASPPKLRMNVQGDLGIVSPRLRKTLTRVAHEALANAVKHAGPTEVTVNLEIGPTEVALSVEDDGAGFDMRQVYEEREGRESLGLLTMQERVQEMGGRLTITSSPHAGTRIHATIALGRAVDNA